MKSISMLKEIFLVMVDHSTWSNTIETPKNGINLIVVPIFSKQSKG
jgi:hypothetical protein